MEVVVVKLFLRSLAVLVFVGLGVQEGTVLGMQDAQSQVEKRRAEAQEETNYAQQQKLIVQAKNAKKIARLAQLELDSKLKKATIESLELDEKFEALIWNREVEKRAKIFKGLLYGVIVPGVALINYNTGNFGINQASSLVMLVVLTYYGVIHAFLVCLSEGVQHVKQIPFRKAINYLRRDRGNETAQQQDLLLEAFESDSE